MNLSDLQLKEIIDISSGKRLGSIIDIMIDRSGKVLKILIEEKRVSKKLFSNNKEDVYILWNQIVKIGDDIILVDINRNNYKD